MSYSMATTLISRASLQNTAKKAPVSGVPSSLSLNTPQSTLPPWHAKGLQSVGHKCAAARPLTSRRGARLGARLADGWMDGCLLVCALLPWSGYCPRVRYGLRSRALPHTVTW